MKRASNEFAGQARVWKGSPMIALGEPQPAEEWGGRVAGNLHGVVPMALLHHDEDQQKGS